MESLLTSDEVRAYFRVAPSTLWRWRQAGRIAALKTPGGGLRFRESDVQKVLQGEQERVPA